MTLWAAIKRSTYSRLILYKYSHTSIHISSIYALHWSPYNVSRFRHAPTYQLYSSILHLLHNRYIHYIRTTPSQMHHQLSWRLRKVLAKLTIVTGLLIHGILVNISTPTISRLHSLNQSCLSDKICLTGGRSAWDVDRCAESLMSVWI